MPKSFTEYFELLGLSRTVRERLNGVLHFYAGLLPEPIERVFVSETVDQEGQRLIENFWMITKGYICERIMC